MYNMIKSLFHRRERSRSLRPTSRVCRSARLAAAPAAEPLEQRITLTGGYVPDLFTPDESPIAATSGSYTPNVIRRFDPASGNPISTASVSYRGLQPAPWSRDIQ